MPGKKQMHYRLRRRQLPKDLSKLVSMADYCQAEMVDESTVRYWISTKKLVGYKIKRRWWIDPESKNREPLYWTSKPLE
ncbi:MAG: hypothetical protein AAF827_03865 [Cyanobacteria bacterium P01_D01_bin.6]